MLKVMTLNLNYYVEKHGSWEIRKRMIRDAIKDIWPDVVAFQAVRLDPAVENGIHQADQLKELLPDYSQVVFEPAQAYEGPSANGSAFLSRLPFVDKGSKILKLRPGEEDLQRRIVVHAQLDLPQGPLHLFNTHFSWIESQAKDNLEETLAYADSFEGFRLLMGDLNNPPNTNLFERFRSAGWFDTWAMKHPDRPGLTFEAGNPTKRIDYAWAHGGLQDYVEDVRIAIDHPDQTGAYASDHYALVVTLSLG